MKFALENLLKEVGNAYEKSNIRRYCLVSGLEWHYSLITTTLEPGGPMILGFNWGAAQGEKYQPQTSIIKTDFSKEDVGSLRRIFPYCQKHLGSEYLNRVSQSNYCFFRSKNENEISVDDISLCEPIFEKMINAVQPSSIICFSAKLRDYLFCHDRIAHSESKSISYKRGDKDITFVAIRARLKSGIEIKFLPHPNYPMKGEARSAAWEFCFRNN